MINPQSIDLPGLFADWYGPEDRPARPLSSELQWLPQSLKDWYELGSRRMRSHRLARKFFAASEIRIEGNKAVFMDDPNEGWRWAFDINVSEAVYEDDGKGEGWRLGSEGLTEFLIHHALDELVFSPTAWKMSARDIGANILQVIDGAMEEVAFRGWSYPFPGIRVLHSEGLVAEVLPAISGYRPLSFKDGLYDISIGANELKRLSVFDDLSGVKWFRRRPNLLPPSDWAALD